MRYAFVTGRLVADAIYHDKNRDGKERPYLSFRLAINSRYKTEEITQYVDCMTFRTQIEPYLTKGTGIAVAGTFFINSIEYEDKTGKTVKSDKIRIVADVIDFLESSRHRERGTLEKSSMAEMNKLDGKSSADPFMMQPGKILNDLPDILDFDDPSPF
jgi:single-stranded DNA-binding protein